SASLSPVGDLGYSAIDQIAQFGLSSLKVIYYSEQLFSFICSGNTMPIVLVDWSDIREQKRLMVLRASVALHGR
ncbi:hypothetical protein AB8S43_29725, partial [Klebsiella pneumoniae]